MLARTLVAALLVVAACGSPAADDAGPTSSPGESQVRIPDGGADASAAPSGGGSSNGGQTGNGTGPPAGGTATSAPRAPGGAVAADQGAVGDNALAYLRETHPRMVIEVDAAAGREPADGTFDHVRSQIGLVVSKPEGISVTVSTFQPSSGRYTLADIAGLERKLRATSTSGRTASLYVLFLNGRYEDASVLGLAYSGSAFAIFKDAVASSASVLAPASAIERSVTLHEVGHLMRLINIGYRSPRDHEDPDHPNHSRSRASVMFWAVESDLISTVINGPPPDSFDDDDLADLADMRSGRL